MEEFISRVPRGSRKKRKRVGRGPSSGHGGTSGKGHKGQKARSGGGVRIGFEGGQMPLFRRLPRRGFSNHRFKKTVYVVNVGSLELKFSAGDIVSPEKLVEAGLVPNLRRPIKLLATGDLTRKLEVRVHQVSASARAKIEGAGGSVVIQTDVAKRSAAAPTAPSA